MSVALLEISRKEFFYSMELGLHRIYVLTLAMSDVPHTSPVMELKVYAPQPFQACLPFSVVARIHVPVLGFLHFCSLTVCPGSTRTDRESLHVIEATSKLCSLVSTEITSYCPII